MPRPFIPLTDADLKTLIDTKPGIFPQAETESFTMPDTSPDKDKVSPPATLSELKKNYKELVHSTPFDENLNLGLYIRIKELRKLLDEFEAEKDENGKGLTHLHISFGLRKAKKDDKGKDLDWNCLHLIMEGSIPTAEFEPASVAAKRPVGKNPERVSKHRYSTYDGDESSYIGAKPGRPPLGPDE